MAKSSSFFGLRKGSTKSLTFSVLDGQQVTKDRVFNVKNPQTIAQANQRYKLASLCNAWRMLSGICDHSFEGVAYGNKSRQKFMSLNLSGVDVVPVPKGSSVAIPYNLCISKGSLYNPFASNNETHIPISGLEEGKGITEAWVTNMLLAFPNLQKGDQISFYGIFDQTEGFTFGNKEYPLTRFGIARIVLDPASPVNVGLKWVGAKTFTTADGQVIDLETWALLPSGWDAKATARGSIISRQVNGSWLRSTSFITDLDAIYDDAYKSAVIATYAATATTATSNKYLNQAEPNI